MSGLFAHAQFAGFGPDPLRPAAGDSPPTQHVSATRRADLRLRLRQVCPKRPGVYGMVDERGTLIYVGKAKVLRQRLLSYFLAANRQKKAGRIIGRTRHIVWEPSPCEFAALIRELELIRRWRPRYNVLGIPGRERQVYVCLGRSPAPYLYVSRAPTGTELARFGPVKGAGLAREAARRLNDLFRLRDCAQSQTMHFSDQRELFPILHAAGCLRYELQTCLGPCAAFTSRSTYARHVRAVRDFLEGRDSTWVRRLEQDMMRAAEQLDFERAAVLRNRLTPMRWLRDRLGWVDEARGKHSGVYSQRDAEGLETWYLIRRARVCAAVPAPIDADSAKRAAEELSRVFAAESGWDRLVPAHAVDHVLLVAAWFRQRPDELRQTFSPTEARLRCDALSRTRAHGRSA